MTENPLFFDRDGEGYTEEDVRRVLIDVGASDCETLFIHSDVVFGRPGEGFRRSDYLASMYRAISGIGVRNIIVPAFTYSFPNHEDYDVRDSRSLMGVLSEYIRRMDGRYRSLDPLLSFSVPNHLRDCFEDTGFHSLGEGSGYDILNRMDGVRFLFLGAEMGECFTYLHYVEKMLEVPYRFDMSFEGTVIDYDGTKRTVGQTIFTHCGGVKLPLKYDRFEQELTDRGILKKKRLGDGFVSCVDKEDARREICDHIKNDPYYFVAVPYKDEDLVPVYGYNYREGKITHC